MAFSGLHRPAPRDMAVFPSWVGLSRYCVLRFSGHQARFPLSPKAYDRHQHLLARIFVLRVHYRAVKKLRKVSCEYLGIRQEEGVFLAKVSRPRVYRHRGLGE